MRDYYLEYQNINMPNFSKYFLLIFILITNIGYSQTSNRILEQNEVDSIINTDVKNEFGIDFPIFRCYEYKDDLGKHYLVLTERLSKNNDSIKGFNFSITNSQLHLDWTMKDFIIKNDNDESMIWFWTKYFSIDDLDKDGSADIIMVYGSKGMNGYDDGRIKILTYYKGIKSGIRHQNGVSDYGRKTKVDEETYDLPKQIQDRQQQIIEEIESQNHGLYPSSWKEDFQAKKTLIKN